MQQETRNSAGRYEKVFTLSKDNTSQEHISASSVNIFRNITDSYLARAGYK